MARPKRTDAEVSWSALQLKEYILGLIEANNKSIDDRFAASQLATTTALSAAKEAVTAALLAADKATSKAELAADTRFASVNEFRGQLADQANTFMPRTEYGLAHQNLADTVLAVDHRMDAIGSRVDRAEAAQAASSLAQDRARAQSNWSTGTIVAAAFSTLGLLVSLALTIFLVIHG